MLQHAVLYDVVDQYIMPKHVINIVDGEHVQRQRAAWANSIEHRNITHRAHVLFYVCVCVCLCGGVSTATFPHTHIVAIRVFLGSELTFTCPARQDNARNK